MPTIISHPAVPLALAWGLGGKIISPRLLLAGIFASIAPDLDVIAFKLGVPYGGQFGHRGASHSLLFALALALAGACSYRGLRSSALSVFFFLLIAAASHSILDACTSGGLGVALLWPWSDHRFFAPFRPIAVSPIGLSRFFSERGAQVLLSELLWLWLPLIGLATFLALPRFCKNKGDHSS
jgi:inner membrane protein